LTIAVRFEGTKFYFGWGSAPEPWGSAPEPAGGAYSARTDPVAKCKGPTSK